MPRRLSVKLVTSFTITSKGSLRFSKSFHNKLPTMLKGIANDVTADKQSSGVDILIEATTDKRIEFTAQFRDISVIEPFYQKLEQRLVLLAEHGSDADLFDELLARYPNLKQHPRLSSVVGAWDNLIRKTKEVAGDESAPVKVELERRQRDGDPELGSEVFESDETEEDIENKRSAAQQTKADLRTAALRGEAPGQGLQKTAKGEPKIPEQYKALQNRGGGKMPKEPGDIFSTNSK